MTSDTRDIKARTNLADYIGQRIELRRESVHSFCGPCPRCGGGDRFVVTDRPGKPPAWWCRGCHKEPGDLIEFVTWFNNTDFRGAMDILSGTRAATPAPVRTPIERKKAPTESPEEWRAHALPYLRQCYRALRADDCPGAAYLYGRELYPETWDRFRLGYTEAASHVDKTYQVPAIVIPWFHNGLLEAIRYRFVTPVNGQRLRGYTGSRHAHLFGEQGLECPTVLLDPERPDYDINAHRSLVVVEGEINAMSIAQACGAARVDVLSIGSESQSVDEYAAFAKRYRTCLVWCDKKDIAQAKALTLGAVAYWSEGPQGKQDANDHLQRGTLARLVLNLLWRHTTQDRDGLMWDIVDAEMVSEMT